MSWPSFSLPFQNYFYGINTIEKPTVIVTGLNTKQYALQSFECFKKSWEIPDFWKRANTSDACLVLLDILALFGALQISTFHGILIQIL